MHVYGVHFLIMECCGYSVIMQIIYIFQLTEKKVRIKNHHEEVVNLTQLKICCGVQFLGPIPSGTGSYSRQQLESRQNALKLTVDQSI